MPSTMPRQWKWYSDASPLQEWACSISVRSGLNVNTQMTSIKGTGRTSLISAFGEGLKTAKGDRLIDVLEIVAYNVEALEPQPEMIIQATRELLPVLADIAADPRADAMLRGTAARVLAIFVPVLECAFSTLTSSRASDGIDIDELRGKILKGYRECLSRPTAVAGRGDLAEALRYLKPVGEACLIARKMLDDPVPGIAAKARKSLFIIEAQIADGE